MTISENKIETIPLEKIKRPGRIDRIDIAEEKVEELANNIQEQGLLQNPLVRKKGEEYEIIAGDRRILAVRKLGWTEVQCVVADMDDTQTAEARGSENLARENLSVVEEAKIYENLNKNHGLTISQIARKMGKSGAIIKRRLDLLKMPKELQTAMHKKQINYGVAEALWPISDPTALDYYLTFAIEHGVTVTVARQWTHDWRMGLKRAQAEGEDPMSMVESPHIRPTYIACDLCSQPELIEKLTLLRVCTKCLKILSGQESG